MTSGGGAVRRFVDEEVTAGLYAVGAQACVLVDGITCVDVAVGSAGPDLTMTSTTLHNAWCASKPIMAMATVLLLDRAGVDLGAPLEAIAPTDPYLRAVRATTWELLNHSAGFGAPMFGEVWMLPPPLRLPAATAAQRPGRAMFSEYGAFRVLQHLLELTYQQDVESLVTDQVLVPLGLTDDIVVDLSRRSFSSLSARIGSIYTDLPHRNVASDHDRGRVLSSADRFAGGAYVTMRGLAKFYEAVGLVLGGAEVAGLPRPGLLADALRQRRGRQFDGSLGRACDFASGFMVDLADFGFGSGLAPAAIGHTGFMGTVFGFVDVDRDCAGAVLLNGMCTVADELRLLVSRGVAAVLEDAAGVGCR
jgi:CubicO group peptidase (beta-lactamase class C family)